MLQPEWMCTANVVWINKIYDFYPLNQVNGIAAILFTNALPLWMSHTKTVTRRGWLTIQFYNADLLVSAAAFQTNHIEPSNKLLLITHSSMFSRVEKRAHERWNKLKHLPYLLIMTCNWNFYVYFHLNMMAKNLIPEWATQAGDSSWNFHEFRVLFPNNFWPHKSNWLKSVIKAIEPK